MLHDDLTYTKHSNTSVSGETLTRLDTLPT